MTAHYPDFSEGAEVPRIGRDFQIGHDFQIGYDFQISHGLQIGHGPQIGHGSHQGLTAHLPEIGTGFGPDGSGIYRNGLKRLLDLGIVILSAPFVLLVVLVLAILIARDGGSPFYSQARVGRGGRSYTIWKLRSMVVDADARLETHLAADPAARAEWNSAQKLKCDPRVTRFGRILRKSSLDELPQLFNVLKGDMSLVGPRPMMPEQQSLYPGHAYYALRPGITGLWQVSERNDSSFADRAGFDAQYDRDLTLATDLKLLAATVRVVLRATGH